MGYCVVPTGLGMGLLVELGGFDVGVFAGWLVGGQFFASLRMTRVRGWWAIHRTCALG